MPPAAPAVEELATAPEDDLDTPPGLPAPSASPGPGSPSALAAPPGLSLPEPARIPTQSQDLDSPAGSLTEPEPEGKAEADSDQSPPNKRFCVWCGKQVPPKLVSAKFCIFCGGVHSGESAGAPRGGKPPGHPELQKAKASALEQKARQSVAAALAEQSAATMMAWGQAAPLGLHGGYLGKVRGVSDPLAAARARLADPVFLPVGGGLAEWWSEVSWDGSTFAPDVLEDDGQDPLSAHRWQRSITAPGKMQMQYSNEGAGGITPAMLYQMQANQWN